MGVKGVIVAAGYGSRFFPVTRAVPKELLPLGDRPAIDWVVGEMVGAGIDEIVIVTSRRKRALEDWFDRDPELEREWAGGTEARLALLRPRPARVAFVRQPAMRGTGDALLLARPFLGKDPFVVAFPDDLFDEPNCTAELLEAHRQSGRSVLATMALPPEDDASRYGMLDLEEQERALIYRPVRALVEKPAPGTEPSREVSLGRYLFTHDVFDALEAGFRSHGTGEYYHVAAVNALAAAGKVVAVRVAARRHDTGTPQSWLRAMLDVALDDPAGGPALRAWLAKRLGLGAFRP
jgi:UTP--glucose-1-phosphate uridylyltransferase